MVGRARRGQPLKFRPDQRSSPDGLLPRGDQPFDGKPTEQGAVAHYADSRYYDLAYKDRREDVQFYAQLAAQYGGPVLEYGVGNGRVALAIAAAGVDLVGVDCSEPMLDDLRAKLTAMNERPRGDQSAATAGSVSMHLGDMRSLQLEQRFPLVIAPFNTVLHLNSRSDVERFFRCVQSHLLLGGRFVFDFSVPKVIDLARDPDRYLGAPRFRHPSEAGVVRYAEQFHYDSLEQTLLVNMRFTPQSGQAGWSVPLTHRQFFPREMEALLHYNGFQDIRWQADFDGGSPHADADSLVVSCTVGSVAGD